MKPISIPKGLMSGGSLGEKRRYDLNPDYTAVLPSRGHEQSATLELGHQAPPPCSNERGVQLSVRGHLIGAEVVKDGHLLPFEIESVPDNDVRQAINPDDEPGTLV